MEAIEIKPTEILCLQTNDSLIELDFIRKCLQGLFDYKNFACKIFNELNAVTDDKLRFEFDRIEQRFGETVRGNESVLQRFINMQEEWTTTDEFPGMQAYCDPNMDPNEVQAYMQHASVAANAGHHIAGTASGSADNSLNASFNSLGEKKDVMAIAAAEVVEHSFRDGLYICGWPSCEYQTSSRRHINNHKLVHTGDGEYACQFAECGKRFKTREEMADHASVHASENPYPCVWPGCGYSSQTPSLLKAHMRVHMENGGKQKCEECDTEFTKHSDLLNHKRIHHQQNGGPGSNTSNQTEVVTNNQQQQQQIALQQQNHTVTVVTQSPGGQSMAQVVQQAQIASNQQAAAGQQQVTLIQLQQPGGSGGGTTIAHKTIVAQPVGNNQAGGTFATIQVQPSPGGGNMLSPVSVGSSPTLFKCTSPSCNAFFSTIYDQRHHVQTHHGSPKSEKPYKCEHVGCDYSAITKTALNEHRITHSTDRNYVCTVENCNRRYKTRKGLWDHSHTHRADKPFMCTFQGCTYRCVSSSYLRSHMRGHKEGTNNIIVQQPGTTVTGATAVITANASPTAPTPSNVTAAALQQQQQQQQPQQFFAPGTIIQHANGHQEFICGIINCNKSFDNQNDYLNHVKTHAPSSLVAGVQQQIQPGIIGASTSAPQPPPQMLVPPPPPPTGGGGRKNRNPELARFKCEFEGCNAAYKLKRNLKDHMIRHTILEKPYRCDWPGCDYGSYKSTNVVKHKSVHSDERKYVCDLQNCDKRFKTREGLRKHLLSHHKVVVNTAGTPIVKMDTS